MMKPIILITIYNRFHELQEHLKYNNFLFNEFDEKPYIIVVWASPKQEYLWIFENLIKDGYIDKLLFRDDLNCDGNVPTTYPESLNLKLGFEYIKNNFSKDSYFIVGQTADIQVEQGTYKLIQDNIKERDAILFFWENGISRDNVWHTNFFAVKNLDYLPPVYLQDDSDVLETRWGKYLLDNNLFNFLRSHNSRSKKFKHLHLSENLPKPLCRNNIRCNSTIVEFIIKKQKWYKRFYKFIRGLIWR